MPEPDSTTKTDAQAEVWVARDRFYDALSRDDKKLNDLWDELSKDGQRYINELRRVRGERAPTERGA